MATPPSTDISTFNVHDAQLYRVVEDIAADTLTLHVDLPILERDEEQEPRLLVFENADNYRVFEVPFDGVVTILDMHIVENTEFTQRVRIETNAGYREVSFSALRVYTPEWRP